MQSAVRRAYRLALEELRRARMSSDERGQERGWKLFFLVSRMLLHRLPNQSQIPKETLEQRVDMFDAGQWLDLLQVAMPPRSRQPPRQTSDEGRALRAEKLVCSAELSAARQALEVLH